MKNLYYIFGLILVTIQSMFGQLVEINKEVKSKIEIEEKADLIDIYGYAENSTDGYKSLFYKLSVIANTGNNNQNKTMQSGRFTLESDEKKLLVKTQINANNLNKLKLILLIYDENQNLISTDNFSINNSKTEAIITPKKINDGIEIAGIISDETKTKIGKDFYDIFYTEYSKLKINSSKIVTVEEEIANRNTRLRIKVDYEVINEFMSKPDEEYLKSMAIDSSSKIVNYLKKIEKQNNEITRY